MPDTEKGEQHAFASRRVSVGAPTPNKLLGFLERIRHPNGDVDSNHPAIQGIMRQAEEDDSDVLVIPRGGGIDVVAGRFLADDNDRNRVIKICAGVGRTSFLTNRQLLP